jgi:hypothetical protein
VVTISPKNNHRPPNARKEYTVMLKLIPMINEKK